MARNAELSGLITDPSRLAVPNPKVVVQSAATDATRTVSSNQHGEYSVPAPYNITIEAQGFKIRHQIGVVVEVDQRAWLDFEPIVGSKYSKVSRCRRALRWSTHQMHL
jgi:hypothetical protein